MFHFKRWATTLDFILLEEMEEWESKEGLTKLIKNKDKGCV